MPIRHDWTMNELKVLYELPLIELITKSSLLHNQFHEPSEIQVCSLISIKTGGCEEDCKYCAQSSHYQTSVRPQPLMKYEIVISEAKKAIDRGATRICLGAAWREVRDGKQFDEILNIIKGLNELGVEVCCTLGMLTTSQAKRLKEAGLYAYNHNLDTSENFYKTIITTRSYQDRLNTLNVVENAHLSVCCGGILGLGEEIVDRLELLHVLCTRTPHPESVPINQLGPVVGTPLENQPKVPFWEVLRVICLARILMPKAMVRLSAGRIEMSVEQQALCFLAGANSIFEGDKLLTIPNTPLSKDDEMFRLLGLRKRKGNCEVSRC